ncbi:hypothetical protein KC878_03345 [Candidatus Saccharibacteria bacterium]|nr:hypothetical protein [Candidatus Saccharibacteria bacterium]MCB9821410.1 hypothetical protein [Candidatus Nomurabacteria bacterium]
MQAVLADDELANLHMVRALRAIISHKHALSDQLVWRLPELYFMESGHRFRMTILWVTMGQASLVYGLFTYRKVFGDNLIVDHSSSQE